MVLSFIRRPSGPYLFIKLKFTWAWWRSGCWRRISCLWGGWRFVWSYHISCRGCCGCCCGFRTTCGSVSGWTTCFSAGACTCSTAWTTAALLVPAVVDDAALIPETNKDWKLKFIHFVLRETAKVFGSAIWSWQIKGKQTEIWETAKVFNLLKHFCLMMPFT